VSPSSDIPNKTRFRKLDMIPSASVKVGRHLLIGVSGLVLVWFDGFNFDLLLCLNVQGIHTNGIVSVIIRFSFWNGVFFPEY
jgi:hypothetical protein